LKGGSEFEFEFLAILAFGSEGGLVEGGKGFSFLANIGGY
jgi:hypothetical protein